MANEFIIKNGFHSKGDSNITGSLGITGISNVSASIAAASGGGSTFPFTGDAQITGSLSVSGSGIEFVTSAGVPVFSIAETGSFALGEGATSLVDTNVVIGKNAKDNNASSANSVVIGSNAQLYNAASQHSAIAIGESANVRLQGVAIGRYSTHYGSYATTVGYSAFSGPKGVAIGYNSGVAGGATSDVINIGYEAGSTGANSIVLNASGLAADPTKANAFGIYLTDTNPVFEIEATGSTTLSGSNLVLTNDISGSATSTASFGTYLGDGSALTGISSTPFPFTGDASITGSLVISASNNTSESLSIQGSGSTIFSIQGSQGQLFSVTDDLLDEVFSVADISGDTLLSVSGSGLVTIPVGDLTGSATATASYGAFKGDGSQLTNLPASDPFPFTGDAQITGSLTISGSFNAFRVDSDDVVMGSGAGASMVAAPSSYNVLIGYQAGNQIVQYGVQNIAIGREAGQGDSQKTIAIGTFAAKQFKYGKVGNLGIGYYALSCGGGTYGFNLADGEYNVALGYEAGRNICDGIGNTMLGSFAGRNLGGYNLGGDGNIVIGYYAGYNQTSGDGNITIGSGSLGVAGESNQLRIGNGNSIVTISGSLETGDVIFASTASADYFVGDGSQLTNLPASSVLTSSYTSEWILGADGTDHYTFSGPGLTGAENDPDIYLVRGQKYRFYNNSGGHPFRIQSTLNGSAGTAYNDGVTNNDAGNGTYLLFDVQFDAPTKLYYQCTSHNNMGGPIYIADAIEHSGSFSGSFQGDGSSLTGLSAFPFTGDAQITGSLIVSSSGITSIGNITASNEVLIGYELNIGDAPYNAQYAGRLNMFDSAARPTFELIPNLNTVQQTANMTMYAGNNNPQVFLVAGSNRLNYIGGGLSIGNSDTMNRTNTNTTGDAKLYVAGNAQISGSVNISGSGGLSVESSGSTLFNVIGSEGTIFSLEDDLDGTLFTVNDRTGIPMFEVSASGRIVAEEGESIIRSQRPMVTHTADFSITSSLDYAGKYHTVGGALTCSINTGSLVPAGAEFEFFQTSSAGNFLFITGSPHVDLIAKNDNRNLAGRGSGATLKYIGGSTFHLVGDLT